MASAAGDVAPLATAVSLTLPLHAPFHMAVAFYNSVLLAHECRTIAYVLPRSQLHHCRGFLPSLWSQYLNTKLHNGTSGKEAALLPLPPLRTGLESFPSSGSSQQKSCRSRTGFRDGFCCGHGPLPMPVCQPTLSEVAIP